MRFDENTAGGMMNTEIVVVGEDATRGEVVDYIRFHEVAPDQLDNIVLINRDAVLAGSGPARRACCWPMANSAWAKSGSSRCSRCKPDTRDNDVFELFDKYNLRSLTVVNEENHPIGAITVDDVVSRLRAKMIEPSPAHGSFNARFRTRTP